jgi:uncharacterized repeat protein (TIGR03803 family)
MKRLSPNGLVVLFCLVLFTAASHSQTLTVLYNFGSNSNDASFPVSEAIVQGKDGNLFSTSLSGGASQDGTVFTITPSGQLSILHSFDKADGLLPFSGLTLSTVGPLYGSTNDGGSSNYGTVFKISPAGQLTVLHNFTDGSDGAIPWCPPIRGADGSLYGTTSTSSNGNGTVYKITPKGKLTTIHTFNGNDGSRSTDPLLLGNDGWWLYGTASYGGEFDDGTAFRISRSGDFHLLHNFGSTGTDGRAPSGLIQASDGNLYGVTVGTDGSNGSVFKLTPAGKLTVLHNFTGGDGDAPESALVQATDGNLYGTTFDGGSQNCGTIFRISLQGNFAVIYNFDGTKGCNPEETPMFQHTNGLLYGTTEAGGSHGVGTFFSLDIGMGPFVSLLSASRKVGKTVEILGQGLTATTAVSFHGTSAAFTVISDTYLKTTVPNGATSGVVTVTTPGGTLTSNKPFRVKP